MGCCNGRNWKREEKADHRFDYLEMSEFHTNAIGCRVGHLYVWLSTVRAFVSLGLDMYTAIGLLVLKSYQSSVTQQTFIAHSITKWIFAGCIILSVVLLIWDWIFAIRIMRSKNISFAFTNVIANRTYSLRSYNHHCLFYRLSSSSHKSNKVAFWVFFSFQGWKRLVLTEGPRQVINALTVFSVLSTRDFSFEASAYANITPYQWTVLSFMSLSLLIWLFSFVRFCIAAIIFLPLLCHIQGGLTEFVVRKIDKRIEKIIEKARKKRLNRYAQARKAEASSGANLAKKGTLQRNKSIIAEKPTLPKIPLMLEDEESHLMQVPAYRGVGSDTDSVRSFGQQSMSKSGSSYSLSAYPMPQADPLPLYRSRTMESFENSAAGPQMIPTIPTLSTGSPPRLFDNPILPRPQGQPLRPQAQAAPSYHRKESYSRQPSGGRQAHGVETRAPVNRSLTDPDRPAGPSRMPQSHSSNSLHSSRSAQSKSSQGSRSGPRA